MKVATISPVSHVKVELIDGLLSFRETGGDVIVVGENTDELTKNKYYDGSLDGLLKSKIESLKIVEPLLLSPEIFSEYKSGRENRRERRKQERKNKYRK